MCLILKKRSRISYSLNNIFKMWFKDCLLCMKTRISLKLILLSVKWQVNKFQIVPHLKQKFGILYLTNTDCIHTCIWIFLFAMYFHITCLLVQLYLNIVQYWLTHFATHGEKCYGIICKCFVSRFVNDWKKNPVYCWA